MTEVLEYYYFSSPNNLLCHFGLTGTPRVPTSPISKAKSRAESL